MTQSPTLKTFLWFNGNLDEALDFYVKTFIDVKIHNLNRPDPAGKLFTADFSIFGHDFIGLNWPGGPAFNDSISLSINCDGQEEVDRYWNAITERGKAGQCGWCVDEFGLSWQVSPIQMRDWLGHRDPEVAAYAMNAMRQMGKIVIDELHR
jgi:predicted 3-demethylubiquinone-9 3-methyltransferase (glyoxalase superfamily)